MSNGEQKWHTVIELVGDYGKLKLTLDIEAANYQDAEEAAFGYLPEDWEEVWAVESLYLRKWEPEEDCEEWEEDLEEE